MNDDEASEIAKLEESRDIWRLVGIVLICFIAFLVAVGIKAASE